MPNKSVPDTKAPSIARRLAHMATNLTFESLPKATVHQAKRALTDYVGNSLAGIGTREGKTVIDYVSQFSGTPKAIFLAGERYPLDKAAFGNGVLSRIVDLDDGHKNATGHPGTAVISAGLTTADFLHSTPRELLPAIVMGYEVYIRIAHAINESAHRYKGYDMTGICGCSAAAMTAGMLLELDETALVNALGIAGSYSGGLYECLTNGSDPKLLVPGWAAATGINSALLASQGFTGPESIYEGKKGLAQGVTDWYDFEKAFASFGQAYEIDGVYFKKYSCMRGTHGGIDAVLGIRDTYGLAPDDIKRIQIFTSSYVKQYDKPFPSTLVGAQGNLPYAVSVGLYNPMVGFEEMERGLSDQRIQEMMKRITVTVVPEIEAHIKEHFNELTTARAEIETRDGRHLTNMVYLASGEPENPIDFQAFEQKFTHLAQKRLSAPKLQRLFHLLMEMDTMDSLQDILDIIHSS